MRPHGSGCGFFKVMNHSYPSGNGGKEPEPADAIVSRSKPKEATADTVIVLEESA
jgi:hypothetical protein